jgi:hypothetical protein
MASKTLKKLGDFSRGVRENAALRDVTLARPLCPNSAIKGKIVNGNYEPPDIQPGMENCQLETDNGNWWENCEARGHNPYYRVQKFYTTVDVEEEDPETGEVYVTAQKRKVRKVEALNVTQVSPSIMHNSGMGVARKMKYRGYKRLKDLGYEEVCQFRGCQKAVEVHADGYGDYCGMVHLNLIAAREDGEFLTYTKTQGLRDGGEAHFEKKRRDQLRNTMPRNVEKVKA